MLKTGEFQERSRTLGDAHARSDCAPKHPPPSRKFVAEASGLAFRCIRGSSRHGRAANDSCSTASLPRTPTRRRSGWHRPWSSALTTSTWRSTSCSRCWTDPHRGIADAVVIARLRRMFQRPLRHRVARVTTVAVPAETRPGERRVALVPESVGRLTALGVDVAR